MAEDHSVPGANPSAAQEAAPLAQHSGGKWRPAGHCTDDAAWAEMSARYGPESRSGLCMGDLSDFTLANAQYLCDRNSFELIGYQTAAKDRIRWLSVQLAGALATLQEIADGDFDCSPHQRFMAAQGRAEAALSKATRASPDNTTENGRA